MQEHRNGTVAVEPGAREAGYSASDVLQAIGRSIESGLTGSYDSIPTGFDPLDEVIGGGLRPGQLVMLAGQQGIGKTTVALQMARQIAALSDATALYLCFEHEEIDLVNRLISLESRQVREDGEAALSLRQVHARLQAALNGARSLDDALDDARVAAALERIRSYEDRLRLMTVYTKQHTVEVIGELVQQVRRSGVERLVVFVDYLQKVQVREDVDEPTRIGLVTERLKELALQARCPVFAIAASDTEGLASKRMRAYHLRGGATLAYEADIILILSEKLTRVARVTFEYSPQKVEDFKRWVICTVEKNRAGQAGVDLEFEKRFAYASVNPRGRFVSEKLTDERLYIE